MGKNLRAEWLSEIAFMLGGGVIQTCLAGADNIGDAELEENGTLNGKIRFDNGGESPLTAKR